MIRRLVLSIWLLLSLPYPAGPLLPAAPSDGPAITILATNLGDYPSGRLPRFAKFEVTFSLDRAYANPFDPGQIQVDGIFISPGQVTSTQPGFYYQNYQVATTANGVETYTPSGDPLWKVRFSPSETGTYQYILRAADADGVTTTAAATFEVLPSSLPGFLRLSAANPRYFEFTSGEAFIGLGLNAAWWINERRRISSYEYYFTRMGANQANLARLWMTNSGQSQDWILSIQDQTLGGDYNLEEAWAFDQILDLARQNGVYLLLTLDDVNQYTYNWGDNLYNSALGGPCSYRSAIFTDPLARQYQQRIFRYIIARWGYSANILSWELFNEIDELRWSDEAHWDRQAMVAWHAEMAGFLKALDAHHHLVNTSTGSFKTHTDLYGPPALDFAEMHFYYVPGNTDFPSDPAGRDIADLTRYYAYLLYNSVTAKPGVIGEWGLLDENWLDSPFLAEDSGGVHLHNGLWSALMSGMAASGLSWHWNQHRLNDPAWWQHYHALAGYFDGLYLAGLEVMKPLNVDFSLPGGADNRPQAFSSTNPALRAMGLRRGDWVYAWVQNKGHTWWNVTHATPISPQTGALTIHNLTSGARYTVETWDTYTTTQQIIAQESLTAGVDGSLQINISALQTDLALKIHPVLAPRLWLPRLGG